MCMLVFMVRVVVMILEINTGRCGRYIGPYYRKQRTYTRNREVTTPRALLRVGSLDIICVLSDISLVYFQYGDDETI